MTSYEEVLARNVQAYDGAVSERAGIRLDGWKLAEHEAFASRLRAAGSQTIVELGAGTGVHGAAFVDAGFDVLCTDPSLAMVEHCRSLGLTAAQSDALSLRLEQPVDAAFAMNSFLHIPASDLGDALRHVRSCLRTGGLFYLGMYGGVDSEGPREADSYVPKRWFVSHSDERLLEFVAPVFEVVDFHAVDLGAGPDFYFQSLTLQAPP